MRFSALWLLLLAGTACSIDPQDAADEPELATSDQEVGVRHYPDGRTVTRIRVRGRSSDVLLAASNVNGFLSASRDQIANTTALDFSYVHVDPANPNQVILIQGAGPIPNAAYTTTATTARLVVTTPFPVNRCMVELDSGAFECAPSPPIAFDLTWVRNGVSSVWEYTFRIETLGPMITSFRGEFYRRAATVNGTFNGYTASKLSGNLLDTESRTSIREITMMGNR